MSALRAFMAKEVRHVLRDRRTLTILILMPLAQVLLFGYALRTEVHDIRIAIVALSPDDQTLRLRGRFAGSTRFRLVAAAPTTSAVETLFRRGEANVAVMLPSGFADRLAHGDEVRVLVVADASDPNSGSTMMSYTTAVIGDFERDLGAESGPLRIDVRTRMRFNPTLASVNLFVPGLIALVLTLVAALMTAISLSREKERGTLEVLLVSPLRPIEIIVGKVIPYIALGLANTVTVLLVAWLAFHVPFRGSVILLLAESLLYTLVSLALGVLIAARTTSQRAAMLGALAGTMMPNALLSGMIFPIASMPRWLQTLTNIIPARWFIVIARGIMLEGVGLEYLWVETLVLVGMGLLLLAAAARSFKPRLA